MLLSSTYIYIYPQNTRLELLHGFVECLEVDDPELPADKTIFMPEEKGAVICCLQ